MSTDFGELVGETNMVTNVEITKEVDEQREKNKVLEESLVEVKVKLDAFFEVARRKEQDECERAK